MMHLNSSSALKDYLVWSLRTTLKLAGSSGGGSDFLGNSSVVFNFLLKN